MGLFMFFCVRDAVATREQYLALSKAWRCCFSYVSLIVFTARCT